MDTYERLEALAIRQEQGEDLRQEIAELREQLEGEVIAHLAEVEGVIREA